MFRFLGFGVGFVNFISLLFISLFHFTNIYFELYFQAERRWCFGWFWLDSLAGQLLFLFVLFICMRNLYFIRNVSRHKAWIGDICNRSYPEWKCQCWTDWIISVSFTKIQSGFYSFSRFYEDPVRFSFIQSVSQRFSQFQ